MVYCLGTQVSVVLSGYSDIRSSTGYSVVLSWYSGFCFSFWVFRLQQFSLGTHDSVVLSGYSGFIGSFWILRQVGLSVGLSVY